MFSVTSVVEKDKRLPCQTKPISSDRTLRLAKHRRKSGEDAQPTKSRSGTNRSKQSQLAVAGGRTNHAKQTQSPRSIPVFHYSAIPGPSLPCETKPIWPGQAGWPWTFVRNKPNWPAGGISHYSSMPSFPYSSLCFRAKQSQFHQGDVGGQVLYRKMVMTNLANRWSRQDKANSRAGTAGPRGYDSVSLGFRYDTHRTNKANLPGRGLGGVRFFPRSSPIRPPAFPRPAVQTNPICFATTTEAAGGQDRSETKPISARQGRPDGPGTGDCERSAAIRPRMPATPFPGPMGTLRCDGVTRHGRMGVAATFGDRRWN